MLKRIVCLVTALVLLTGCASAASYGSLPEKTVLQLDLGSGLKGSLTISVSGSGPLAAMLSALSGQPIEVRGIKSGTRSQTLLYLDQDGQQAALTQIDGADDTYTISSQLLPGKVYSLSTGGDLIQTVVGREDGSNPIWYSLGLKLLRITKETWETAWEPVLAPYYGELESWLNDYASAPAVTADDDGTRLLTVRYEIPSADVAEETVYLLESATVDDRLTALLRELMTEEQAYAYLNQNLLYWYRELLGRMNLKGSTILERQLTVQGEEISASAVFPLLSEDFETLKYEQNKDASVITLTGTKQDVTFRLQKGTGSDRWEGAFALTPKADADGKPLAFAYSLTKTFETSQDPDTREHERTHLHLTLTPEEGVADNLLSDRAEADLLLHFYSKNAKNSPTTLEAEGQLQLNDLSLELTAKFKTSSPWVLQPAGIGGEDLLQMTEEQRAALAAEMLTALAGLTRTAQPEAAESPETAEDGATPSDLTE